MKIQNPLMMTLMSRLYAPMGDDGGAGGGAATLDRGDDWDPPEDDDADDSAAGKGDTKAAGHDDDDIDPEDPDGEKEEKPEEKAEDKAEDKKRKESRIPLSRHKELLEKERAKRAELEQRLNQYQQGNQVASLNEDITKAEDRIMGLEKEYAKLLADGEVEKASTLMSQIRNLERQVVEAKSDMKIAAAEARATERARYNIALERIEGAYPELNPDHDSFDEELLSDVADLKASYESRRNLTPTMALQKAVEKLLGSRTKAQERVLETTPRVSDKDVAKEVAAERKKEGTKRTAEAVSKQPPSLAKSGLDSDKAGGGISSKDIMKMSQEDFAKLDEDTLKRLRGDDF